MNCSSKNGRYKSTVDIYNNASQALTSTPSPLTLVGTVATNTGIALDPKTSTIDVTYPGTFLVSVDAIFTATTAGQITLQLYSDGVALPETARTITVPVGTSEISTSTIRRFVPNCQNPISIQVYANTDGTAVGNVTLIDSKAVKLG